MTKNEILKDGKYTQKYIAERLYPNLDKKSAMAKLCNKLNNKDKRYLTEHEIELIKNILK